ncbi:hypothetical protein MTR67_046135 [Solanum verrucosum]|uniref:Uncharacterized protein n=1 Tax=Solanum verrucosum TaxID=315347 RepID=A0AAF0UU00_SOLVR|nr:hypothetical protein MTR67_046135 [Solanum verrucosum]
MKRLKYPLTFRIGHFLNLIAQLPKGITHSYKLGIVQTWRSWKEYSKIFPTISRSTPNSS